GACQLVVRNLHDNRERVFTTDGNVATPEWSLTSEQLYATVMANGAIDIMRFPAAEAVTRMSGGAFQPAPSPDGRLFFMALDPDGFNVRVLTHVEPAPPRTPFDRSLVPALPPARATPVAFAAQPLPPSRPYGIGRQE